MTNDVPNREAEAAWEAWLESGRGALDLALWRRVCGEGHGYFTDGFKAGADAFDREREANRELREAAARFEEMVERRKRPDGGGVTEFEWNTRRDAMVNLSRALLHPEEAGEGGKA